MKKREPNPHLVRLIVWSKAKRKVLGLSIDFSSSAQEHESLGSMAIAPGNVFQRRIPVRKKTPKHQSVTAKLQFSNTPACVKCKSANQNVF